MDFFRFRVTSEFASYLETDRFLLHRGRSEASSVFPSSTVSGGSGSVSGSYSRSTGVEFDGGVQRTPSGKVRQRSQSRTEEVGGG